MIILMPLYLIFHKGKIGETYNVGGFNEWKNIDLIKVIIKTVDRLLERDEGSSDKFITYVKFIGLSLVTIYVTQLILKNLQNELGWKPFFFF